MKLNSESNYTKGLAAGAAILAIFFLAWHVVLVNAGEIDIEHVIHKQSVDSSVLFSSGINQNAFRYKLSLLRKREPETIAVGSSRAMQFRQQLFKGVFLNMGGAISHVGNLEQVSKEFKNLNYKPELILLMVDPWWFNANYPAAKHHHLDTEYPEVINSDLIFNAIKAFERGNWLLAMTRSNNLGIHSILTGEGFSVDGSYHYTSTITSAKPASDVQFSNTLSRIKNGNQRFEKASHADKELINRACNAIMQLEKSARQLVLIAPPFSKRVWSEIEVEGYEYIQDAHSQLQTCSNLTIHDYSNPESLTGSSDCEFIDGFHGGDITAARMLKDLIQQDTKLKKLVDEVFVGEFVDEFSGNAAGITTSLITNKIETDFLRLGCHKTPHQLKIDRAI